MIVSTLFERAALDFEARVAGLFQTGHIGVSRAIATIPGEFVNSAWIADEVAGVGRVIVMDWDERRGVVGLEYNTLSGDAEHPNWEPMIRIGRGVFTTDPRWPISAGATIWIRGLNRRGRGLPGASKTVAATRSGFLRRSYAPGLHRPPFEAEFALGFEAFDAAFVERKLAITVDPAFVAAMPAGYGIRTVAPSHVPGVPKEIGEALPAPWSDVVAGNLVTDGVWRSNSETQPGRTRYWRFALVTGDPADTVVAWTRVYKLRLDETGFSTGWTAGFD